MSERCRPESIDTQSRFAQRDTTVLTVNNTHDTIMVSRPNGCSLRHLTSVLSKRINKRVKFFSLSLHFTRAQFSPATPTPRGCTQRPLARYRLHCILKNGRVSERQRHCLQFYALATRWTMHTRIDSCVIFTYYKIFGATMAQPIKLTKRL